MTDFDEDAYLRRYPDVASAVAKGQFESGLAHYERHGRSEGRSGAAAASNLPRWWEPASTDRGLLGTSLARMNVRTVANLNETIVRNLHRIDPNTACLIGIPRSGMMAAALIALHLNLPLVSPDDFIADKLDQITGRTGTRHSATSAQRPVAYLIDDSMGTGGTMKRMLAKIESCSNATRFDVRTLAVYPENIRAEADVVFEVVSHPRVFEWNLMHHDYCRQFCFDLDGVMCEDPTSDENDEDVRYLHFLEHATPKCLPTKHIGAIVTSRLEKFRSQTTKWLEAHRVSFTRLIMLDLPSGHERRRLAAHAKFKADVYNELGGYLFIESDANQAREIARLTGKSVYCFANSSTY